jgi:hypothetical protein
LAHFDSRKSPVNRKEIREITSIPKWILEGDNMFIQGDLQAVFDALHEMGHIDPVLQLDWSEVSAEMTKNPIKVQSVIAVVNSCRGNRDQLIEKLKKFDSEAVNFIALEVAREFAEFSDCHALH